MMALYVFHVAGKRKPAGMRGASRSRQEARHPARDTLPEAARLGRQYSEASMIVKTLTVCCGSVGSSLPLLNVVS